jgi:glycosyltransferase involved in cell wall biosynthesis
MRKRVVHISKVTGIHGTEKHLLSLLPELNRNYEIIFIILTEPDNPVTEYFQMLKIKGIKTFNINIWFDIAPLCFLKIFFLLKKLKPSLVHTHLIHGDIYGITASWAAGIGKIVSTRHNDDSFRKNRLLRAINIFLNIKTDSVIAISEWVGLFANKIERIKAEKIKIIHYGLGETMTSGNRNSFLDEIGFAGREVVLGIVARLVEQKGHYFLIEAFSKAFKENPDIRLLIVGDGELKDRLQSHVRREHLDKAVVFTGYKKNVPDILDSIDIFIHPSLWEGFGLSILEAMSMGKPVIATNVSAIPELIEDGVSGLLVPPKDVDSLAGAIIRLSNDESLREQLGQKAKERWKNTFSVDSMVNKTMELYDSLLSS